METATDRDEAFMREAVALARSNRDAGGRPFGAVLVHEGKVQSRAVNETHVAQDPTAHAELLAIRYAAQAMGRLRLDGSTVYASGHPCPMC
ncbi:MAG: nucleoside deaminase, partial [Gammaproteobacteria bacterium]